MQAADSSQAPSAAHFYLQPRYKSPRPLDAILLKAQPGSDEFVTEKYASQIDGILGEWSAGLLRSPQDLKAIERVFSDGFAASSLHASESRERRPGPVVSVQQLKFAQQTSLRAGEFLGELQSVLSTLQSIISAEFQITRIDTISGASHQAQLRTRIRYEIVGTGKDFHREQWVGHSDLVWDRSNLSEFRLLSWQAIEETRSRAVNPVFVDISQQALGSNAAYSSQLLHGTDYWRTVLDGASGIDIYGHNGVSMADIDGDGLDDLYVCQPAGLPNRLFRNRGDGTFEDITESSGLGILENTACALFADFDNDGRQDVIVVRAEGPLLFLNQGDGKFRRKPDAFRFASPPQGTFTGAAVADYDRDGWLDIYFCLYIYYQGTDQYKYPLPYYAAENGPPNFMMRNHRDGTFKDVTAESGLNQNNTRYSFCCAWNDYNRDGWPDLYVVNDFGRKNLYRNNGDGTFTDVAAYAGVEDVGAGMSVCWTDYDNDGHDDLYVGNMWTAAGERVTMQEIFKKDAPADVLAFYRKHAMGNSLFRGDGETFQDTTAAAGVGLGRWAWSSDAWDFDHDGFPDLYIANGMISGPSHTDLNSFFWRQVVAKSPDVATPSHKYEQGWNAINELIRSDGTWSGYERNVVYANNGDGTFSDVSAAVGLDFVEDGRAFALGDLDHDGRLEIALKNRNGPQLRILKNVTAELPPSILFHLRGTKSNRDAIGAEITVETDLGRQTRDVQCGSGFLAQHSKYVFFGLGKMKGPVRASIRWPSGLVQRLDELPINHAIWVEEGLAQIRTEQFAKTRGLEQSNYESQETDPFPNAAETWLLEPVFAPHFSLPDLDHRTWALSSLRSSPLLLIFWTAKSAACRRQLDAFEQLAHLSARELRLLAVHVDDFDSSVSQEVSPRRRSFPTLRATDDVAAVYNILYRSLFDRHRDLTLPTSFLINEKGEIVKLYQGPVSPERVKADVRQIPRSDAERLDRALPFRGVSETFEFGRNSLAYGSIFFQRGYLDQAGAWFREALHNDPSSAEASYGLGSVYLNTGDKVSARECFERAVTLRASYPDTLPNSWNNLGLLAGRDERTEEAIEDFQKALDLAPDHVIALQNLGNAYRQSGRWQEARKAFDRALAFDPDNAEANYGLAMVFAQADETQSAFEHLQRALQSRPEYPEALNNLGVLYLRTERPEQAVAAFEKCIDVAPAFDQSYLNLARVYALEAQPEKARQVLQSLLRQHPDHALARQMLDQLAK